MKAMPLSDHLRKYSFVWAVVAGILTAVLIFSPLSLCMWKQIFGIPCPGCGLTRAVIHILHFDFAAAIRQNILVLPAIALSIAGAVCFFAERFFSRQWFGILCHMLTSKNAIVCSAVIALLSLVYNVRIGN